MQFCPYRFRVVHGLKPIHALQRIQFCNWMLKTEHDGLVGLELLVIANKAYLCLSGYVNSQNTQIWSYKSPHTVHQIPLLDMKMDYDVL
jgi:hypothetical protein